MELTISKGRMSIEENQKDDLSIGTIAIDSVFTPIKNVNYDIEDYRVGQKQI